MQLSGGPVAEQAAGVEQAVEQADDAIVMQFDAGHAAGANTRCPSCWTTATPAAAGSPSP